jgi:malate/lactate dehydrogenase
VRIAIVGAGGGVGASVAFNLLVREEPFDVLMVDGRSRMAQSHAMDFAQLLAAGATGSVRTVALDRVAEADVVVVCAAVPQTVNRSRLVHLRDNAEILASVVAALGDAPAWPGVLLVVTNPVDVLCTLLVGHHGLHRRRVIGYTANDSLRLRTAVGEALGVAPDAVDAWVLGEHGDRCVALLDRVTVAGVPVTLDDAQRRAAEDFVRGWYARHVALDSGRSSTWTTGHGVARMIAAMRDGDPAPWPASVALAGEYGIEGVALGVPVRLGARGVEAIEEWDLAAHELAGLRAAAGGVAEAAALSAGAARAPR